MHGTRKTSADHCLECLENWRHAASHNRQQLPRTIERRSLHQFFHDGEAVAFDRMPGLDSAQLDELAQMISDLLGAPWDKGNGRPRKLTMREAIIVTCGYDRNNITEEIWAEIFDVDQSTVSRHITFLTPLIEQATAEPLQY